MLEHGDALLDVLVEMAADRRDPTMTMDQVLEALERAGVARFAERARVLRSP
jgi:hypothetical protein